MITHDEARDMIAREIESFRLSDGDVAEIADEHTIERPWGWVFFYNSRQYRATGEFGFCLTGNAPYIVNRSDGSVEITGTARSIEHYIAEYETKIETQTEAWALQIDDDSSTDTLKSIRNTLGLNLSEIRAVRSCIPGTIRTGARSMLEPMCAALLESGISAKIIQNPDAG